MIRWFGPPFLAIALMFGGTSRSTRLPQRSRSPRCRNRKPERRRISARAATTGLTIITVITGITTGPITTRGRTTTIGLIRITSLRIMRRPHSCSRSRSVSALGRGGGNRRLFSGCDRRTNQDVCPASFHYHAPQGDHALHDQVCAERSHFRSSEIAASAFTACSACHP